MPLPFFTFHTHTVCGAKESVWICVTCGQLNCGRYVKAHALSHYEKAPEGNAHPVCLECNELSVFWCVYIIDDYQILLIA